VSVDPRAVTGFATAVEAYDRARPAYPADGVGRLARELGVGRDSVVLDLAAGTGKLTRDLLQRAGRVIAVEPSAPMRAALRANVPAAEVLAGTAEAIPLPGASVDAVFVGQAFHWFRAVEAGREIARVLTTGGGLAMLWNRADWNERDQPWLADFDALVTPHRRAAGRFPAEDVWPQELRESGLFEPLSEAEARHRHDISGEELVALVSSWSWIANLPERERTAVLSGVRRLVAGEPRLSLPYRTELYWTRKA
jgi:SAM-dependent methyltransferase